VAHDNEEAIVHVQVINFKLSGITEGEYFGLCDELAPAFAAVPGLLSKVWLADSANGVYGGVYIWDSAASMGAFAATDLFAGVASSPNLTELTSRDYGVVAEPTAVTSRLPLSV
jgi:hypothetical protein